MENKGFSTHGLDPQTATLMFTVSGIMAAISMPIIGRMLDRFRSNLMFAGGLLVMSTSLSVGDVCRRGLQRGDEAVFGINNGVTMTYFSFFALLAENIWEYPGNCIDDHGRGLHRPHTLGDSSGFHGKIILDACFCSAA